MIDLSDVDLLDERGIAVIVSARNRLPENHDVVLRRPNRLVRRVLAITGMDGTCVIED